MHIKQFRIWDPDRAPLTDEAVYLTPRPGNRRRFLKTLAAMPIVAAPFYSGCSKPSLDELDQAGDVSFGDAYYPVPRNPQYQYGRDETARLEASTYCNFYEFTSGKAVYTQVDRFHPNPWTVQIDGLCRNPFQLDLDDIFQKFSLEERAYRHRCVETWAMCVPWSGFPLADLVKKADPLPEARYVEFQSFFRPEEATQQQYGDLPWPYTEGLTLAEAANPLPFLATGIYGRPLPKQHGSPLRLVVPWKYGFKSIKSIVRIRFTSERPATFWNALNPDEYGFESNVDPDVPHPRWSQRSEWMLGTRERFPTLKYNGYEKSVAALYR